MTDSIGILLVDDEPLVRAGLAAILETEPDLRVLGEAGDGSEVGPLAARLAPDVILMDVRMPGIDGIQATRTLVSRTGPDGQSTGRSGPRILILTTFESDEYVYQALRAGADGFLLKRARPGELVAAVRAVAAGESLVMPQAIRRLVELHGTARGDRLAAAGLSEREAEVLRLLAAGLNNAEIAGSLFLGTETVKTHVAGILAKLGVRDRTQAVIAAYEAGFVEPGRG